MSREIRKKRITLKEFESLEEQQKLEILELIIKDNFECVVKFKENKVLLFESLKAGWGDIMEIYRDREMSNYSLAEECYHELYSIHTLKQDTEFYKYLKSIGIITKREEIKKIYPEQGTCDFVDSAGNIMVVDMKSHYKNFLNQESSYEQESYTIPYIFAYYTLFSNDGKNYKLIKDKLKEFFLSEST